VKALSHWIGEWANDMVRRNAVTAQTANKYLRQVGTFEGTVLGDLTPPKIRKWLQGLPVGQPNRYRAAMSAFCSFLTREGVIATNPVREVPSSAESTPRDRHLTPTEAKGLVTWLDHNGYREAAFLQAILLCTAADVESALALKLESFHADNEVMVAGTKTNNRHRVCYVTKSWAPIWDIFVRPYLARRMTGEPLFRESYFLHRRRFEKALAALGIADYTMKDHRHTWAVQAFRDGIPLHAIAHQLGHSNPAMALKVYGRHQSRAADFGL
jgi:integrase